MAWFLSALGIALSLFLSTSSLNFFSTLGIVGHEEGTDTLCDLGQTVYTLIVSFFVYKEGISYMEITLSNSQLKKLNMKDIKVMLLPYQALSLVGTGHPSLQLHSTASTACTFTCQR